MKKLLLFLLSLIIVSTGWSQITVTATTYGRSPRELTARNITGSLLTSVSLMGEPDTSQILQVTGTATDSLADGPTSLAVVKFEFIDLVTGKFLFSYVDTLRHSIQHVFPKFDSLGVNDSIYNIILGTNSVSTPAKFEFQVKEVTQVRLGGDTLTTKPNFSVTADSLNTF